MRYSRGTVSVLWFSTSGRASSTDCSAAAWPWKSGGRYSRTLELLGRSRRYAPGIPTKSSVMVGLGEERDELAAVFKDLRDVDCQILTIGQYLRPSPEHTPMVRYYHPDEFHELKQIALDLGFVQVESGPLVRSSYHAHETADSYQQAIVST